MQVGVGDKVYLSDSRNPLDRVANGTVIGVGGSGSLFHNRPIPADYLRVNLHSVSVNVPLMVTVEDAEQTYLEDALGSSVLWLKSSTFLDK